MDDDIHKTRTHAFINPFQSIKVNKAQTCDSPALSSSLKDVLTATHNQSSRQRRDTLNQWAPGGQP